MSSPQPWPSRRRDQFHSWLLDAVQADHRWLTDVRTPTGIYIDNGSRYYLDAGNHNEFSSPESFTPRQIAVYDRANERNLLRAKTALQARPRPIELRITKNNINFSLPDSASWGQHEAYTCWIPLEAAAVQLIPHLASRVAYAGAGCLSAHPDAMGFEVSQRARHMKRSTGKETQHDRAIFCTRAWKPSDVSEAGWVRTNLICKDSQRCSFGMYLTYGVTGLLLMIMNEGHKIGGEVQLKDPVAAMRSFSLDPWMKTRAPLAGGEEVTAIDIQRAYLREAQPHVESGEYPDWTAEVFDHWSATLDQLESNPLRLADRLDTYLKLTIYDHLLKRAGLSWEELHGTLQGLDHMRHTAPEPVIRALLNENPSGLDEGAQALFQQLAKRTDLQRVGLDRLRFAVRLQALELNYHELGGLFDQMADAGQVDPVVVTPDEVELAMYAPPAGGRAEARSKSIAEYHGQPWGCDWQYVANQAEEKWIDLRDPFTDRRQVTALTLEYPPRPSRPSELADVLVRIVE